MSVNSTLQFIIHWCENMCYSSKVLTAKVITRVVTDKSSNKILNVNIFGLQNAYSAQY